jgi:hypothetical protein
LLTVGPSGLKTGLRAFLRKGDEFLRGEGAASGFVPYNTAGAATLFIS